MKGIYTYNGTEYEFEYKTVLTAMQRLMTIMNIEQVMLQDGHYYSLLKDIAVKYYILRAYAPDFEYPTAITDADGDLDWDEIEIFSPIWISIPLLLKTPMPSSFRKCLKVWTMTWPIRPALIKPASPTNSSS